MVFAHDTEMALQAAAWLANSDDDPDTLTTLPELRAHLVEFDYSVPRPATRADLEQIRALRPHLRALLTAERDAAAALVNDTLRQASACPAWCATTRSTGTCTRSPTTSRWRPGSRSTPRWRWST